jgi:hypothetical protein
VFRQLSRLIAVLEILGSGRVSFLVALFRNRAAVAAENLFLRKQLALFQEREKEAKRTTTADRFVFSKLARLFDWRNALVIVKPATLVGWHRTAFRRFWRWKLRPVGRPQVTAELRRLIRRMAADNPTWGEERIADELLLKLQVRLSPRTVGKCVKPSLRPRDSRPRSTESADLPSGLWLTPTFTSTNHTDSRWPASRVSVGKRRMSSEIQLLRSTALNDHAQP